MMHSNFDVVAPVDREQWNNIISPRVGDLEKVSFLGEHVSAIDAEFFERM